MGIVFSVNGDNYGHGSSSEPLGNCCCSGHHADLPGRSVRLERFRQTADQYRALDADAGFTQLYTLDCFPRCGNGSRGIMAGPRGAAPGCDRRRRPLRSRLRRRCAGCQQAFSGRLVFRLRSPFWDRHGDGLHLPGCHAGEVVPGSARADDRRRGLRIWRGRACHESHRSPRNLGAGSGCHVPDPGDRVLSSGRDHRSVLPESSAGLASRRLGAAFLRREGRYDL